MQIQSISSVVFLNVYIYQLILIEMKKSIIIPAAMDWELDFV